METNSGSEDISEIHAWRLALELDAPLDADQRCNSPPHFPHKGVSITPPPPSPYVVRGPEGDAHGGYNTPGTVGFAIHECATSPTHRDMQHPQAYAETNTMMVLPGGMCGATWAPMQHAPQHHNYAHTTLHATVSGMQSNNTSPTHHHQQFVQKGAESGLNAMYTMNTGCTNAPMQQQQHEPMGICTMSASQGCDSPLAQHHYDHKDIDGSPMSMYVEHDLNSPTHRQLYGVKGMVPNAMYDAHQNSGCNSPNLRQQYGVKGMMPSGMCDANQMSRSDSPPQQPYANWGMLPNGMCDPHQNQGCDSAEQQQHYAGKGLAPTGMYNINNAGCSSPVHQQQQCAQKGMDNMASSEMFVVSSEGCHSPTHQQQQCAQKTMDALPTGFFVNQPCNSSPPPLHFHKGMTIMSVDPYNGHQAHVAPLPIPAMAMQFHVGPQPGQYQPNNPPANYAPTPHPLIIPGPGPFHTLPFAVNRPNGLEMAPGDTFRGNMLPQVQQVGSGAIEMPPPGSYFLDRSGAAYSQQSEQFPLPCERQHQMPLYAQRTNVTNLMQTLQAGDSRNLANEMNDMPPLYESDEEFSDDFAFEKYSSTVMFDAIPHFWGEKEIREMCGYHGVQPNEIDSINVLVNNSGDTQSCFINFFDIQVAQEFRSRMANDAVDDLLLKPDAQQQKDNDNGHSERVPSKILSLSAELAKERTTISISSMICTPTVEAPTSSQDESGNPQEHNSVRKKKKASKAKKRVRITSADANEGMTTVMMRNIPNKYTPEELLSEFEAKGFLGTFNFMYLPMDFCNRVNLGYCFLNFIRSETIDHFTKAFTGAQLQRYVTRKVIEVFPAETQGFEKNVQKFLRGESKRIQNPWFRPMVFREHEGKCVCLPLREKALELFYDDASLTRCSSMWSAANDPNRSSLS